MIFQLKRERLPAIFVVVHGQPGRPVRPARARDTCETWMANPSLASVLWRSYCTNTDSLLKLIDCFLIYYLSVWNWLKIVYPRFLLMDCVLQVAAVQVVYCVTFGSYPFNAFLAGFMSSIGMFILTGTSALLHLYGLTNCIDGYDDKNICTSVWSLWCLIKDIHCLNSIIRCFNSYPLRMKSLWFELLQSHWDVKWIRPTRRILRTTDWINLYRR